MPTRNLKWPYAPDSIVAIRDIDEHIQRHWLDGAYYEANRVGMLRHIDHKFGPGLVYVDVGASIGNHTLFFCQVMQAAHIYAIEPVEQSLDHLRQNIKLTDVEDRVTVIKAAASDRVGQCQMERYHPSNNAGMWRVNRKVGWGHTRLAPFDDLLEDVDHIDVIKIDVEHHNLELIHGAKKTFAERDAVVYIEAESEAELAEVDLLMGRFGYLRTPGVELNYTPTYEYTK